MSDKTYDTTIVKFAKDDEGNLKLVGLYDKDGDQSIACNKVTVVPSDYPTLGTIKIMASLRLQKAPIYLML
jgi:hypothetical protein